MQKALQSLYIAAKYTVLPQEPRYVHCTSQPGKLVRVTDQKREIVIRRGATGIYAICRLQQQITRRRSRQQIRGINQVLEFYNILFYWTIL